MVNNEHESIFVFESYKKKTIDCFNVILFDRRSKVYEAKTTAATFEAVLDLNQVMPHLKRY